MVALGLRYSIEKGPAWSATAAFEALVSVTLVFFYLMGVNDYFDVEIDSSKKERAVLAKGEISMTSAQLVIVAAAFIGLTFAYLVSLGFFVLTLVVFSLSSLYSIPPIRYKRFYPFSTLGEVAGAFVLFPLGFSVVGAPTVPVFIVSTLTTLVASSARLRQEARNAEFDTNSGKGSLAVVHGASIVKDVSKYLLAIALGELFLLRFIGLLSNSMALLTGSFVVAPTVAKHVRGHKYLGVASVLWGFGFFLVAVFFPGL